MYWGLRLVSRFGVCLVAASWGCGVAWFGELDCDDWLRV